MPRLSADLGKVAQSPISAVFSLAGRLKEEGRDIIDLSIGEPDFPTPDHICEAGIQAIRDGHTKYTGVDGTSALKRAIQQKLACENGLSFDLDQIVVGSGVKPILYRAFAAMLDPGDEVVIGAPYWTSYPAMVKLGGGRPVIVETRAEEGFKIRPEDLDRAIGARTKAVALNSPGNPTGAVYDAAELRGLADVLLDYPHVWVLSDDIYEHLTYDGVRFATICAVEPKLMERAITFNGLSKGFAMTGWRVGYAAGARDLMAGIRTILSQSTGNPCSISQVAAIAALTGPTDYIEGWRQAFQARRDFLVSGLNQIEGLACAPPEGAFFVYVGCGGLLGRRAPDGQGIGSSADLARWFLERAGVACVPGSAFGLDPFLRLSFAAPADSIEKACGRLRGAVRELA